MASSLADVTAYKKLLQDVGRALSSGLVAAERMLEYARLKTYWTIGKCVSDQAAVSNGSIKCSQSLYAQICRDLKTQMKLDVMPNTIQRSVQFYKSYPVFPENTTLTFTHYLMLQRVKDVKARQKIESQAIKENWPVIDIKAKAAELHLLAERKGQADMPVLKMERGQPYVYYARRQPRLKGKSVFMIDCGFRIVLDWPKGNHYQPQDNGPVRSVKEKERYRITRCANGADLLYTYKAAVTKIIDGDTFDANVDVGFGIGIHERFRLKGIDAPELMTSAGQASRLFVKEYLAKCPAIIIRSIKSEMYGRWLADVFALPGCEDPFQIAAEGEYLNQMLLNKGFANEYR